jgi:type IV secretion system protein VirB9
MTKTPAFILALALFSTPALAASDPRLRSVHYETDKVVSVQGRLGYQSMIEFGNGEQIENVAVGDSSAWQVTPNKRANLLFLKPLFGKAKTNMTVVTDQRTYLFDLSVASTGAALYNLRFTYGARPPGVPQQQEQRRRLAYPTLLANASGGTPVVAHPKVNYEWKAKGKKDILPTRTYDDGRAVYLQWNAGVPMPAIYARDGEGRESLTNYRQVGGFIVIDQVPHALVMRLGKKTGYLINRHPPKDQPFRIAER